MEEKVGRCVVEKEVEVEEGEEEDVGRCVVEEEVEVE